MIFQCLYFTFLHHISYSECRKTIKNFSDLQADTCIGVSADRRTVMCLICIFRSNVKWRVWECTCCIAIPINGCSWTFISCCEQLIILYWVAFFDCLFNKANLFFYFPAYAYLFFHIICLFYSLKDLIDDLGDYLDLKVRKSTTKNGK